MRIKFTLTEKMLGTRTANETVLTDYIGKKASDIKDEVENLNLTQEDILSKLDEKGTTIFNRDEETRDLFIWNYMIKGLLKHRADCMRKNKSEIDETTGKKKKSTKWGAIKGKIDDYVIVIPRKISLGKKEADGILERPLRAMTMQGQRVSLARSEYVNSGTSFECEIKTHNEGPISDEMIIEILDDAAEWGGIGQWRNANFGSFTYKILDK